MKKFILLIAVVFSLTAINESVYGKPGNGKGRDKSKSEKPGKGYSKESQSSIQNQSEGNDKNQKALDAQKNWGQLKKELKNEDGEYDPDALDRFFGVFRDPDKDYTDKEIKDAIKAEKVIRRELRKNEDSLPKGATLERLVNHYLYGDTDHIKETYLGEFEDKSLERMDRAKGKYDAALERLEED